MSEALASLLAVALVNATLVIAPALGVSVIVGCAVAPLIEPGGCAVEPRGLTGPTLSECGTHWASTVFGAMRQFSQLSGL